MSRLVLNRDGGSADEYGHLLALSRLITGEVIQGMAVAANASPSMGVRVQAGLAAIPIGASPTDYREFATIDTTSPGEAVTITTASASNPRNDLIVAYVNRSLTPSTATPNNPNMLVVAAVAGTPAASPSDPSGSAIQTAIGAANPYIILARVLVGTSVTQITNANITDMRVLAHPRNSPVFAPLTADFVIATATATQVTGLTINLVTPSVDHLLKITAQLGRVELNSGAGTAVCEIWDGPVGTGTKLASSWASFGGTSYAVNVSAMALLTPSAPGVLKTFNVSIRSTGGFSTTVKASSTEPALLLAEVL